LRRISSQFGARIKTLFATTESIETSLQHADLVIGAVLVPGAEAPKLISHAILKSMQPGSVIVDVAIDQGGCAETSRATTHSDPVFVVDGVVHYCVANMPGAVARTATHALNAATLPFVIALADKGWQRAIEDDLHLKNGLNVVAGQIVHRQVAAALHQPWGHLP
jgi:alanine dehydrogenase